MIFRNRKQPNPAVLPKNAMERAIWRSAVREAWKQGLAEADQLYADNVSRMARSYRGVMLYHLLTAQHLLSRVNTASSNLGTRQSDNGNKLNIGQKVYRLPRLPRSRPRLPLPGRKEENSMGPVISTRMNPVSAGRIRNSTICCSGELIAAMSDMNLRSGLPAWMRLNG